MHHAGTGHLPLGLYPGVLVALLGVVILRTRLRETYDLCNELHQRLRRAVNRDYVEYDGVDLPPHRMRVGGAAYQSDEFFVSYADSDVERLVDWFGFDERSRVLDIGCGQCRLAIGLIRRFASVGRYCGVDIDAASIDWGRRHIGMSHPEFEFVLLDVANERYNPTGRPMDESFRIPFAAASFDLVYMAGVVPHLLPDEMRTYLRECVRLLEPGGNLYLTGFVEEGVPAVAVNPVGYLGRTWEGPRNCVRYEAGFLLSMIDEAGFEIVRFEHGTGQFGQSLIAASLRA